MGGKKRIYGGEAPRLRLSELTLRGITDGARQAETGTRIQHVQPHRIPLILRQPLRIGLTDAPSNIGGGSSLFHAIDLFGQGHCTIECSQLYFAHNCEGRTIAIAGRNQGNQAH